jgi:dipeptidyl aminopeptidase/acylaminoacyl peptidase
MEQHGPALACTAVGAVDQPEPVTPKSGILMKKIPVLFFIFFVLVSCPLWGQAKQKRQLTTNDYDRWGTTELQNVSEKGEWASYKVSYDNGADTLFVRNRSATKTYAFAKSHDGKFIGDGWFLCRMPESQLGLVNLSSGNKRQISAVNRYQLTPGGDLIYISDGTFEITTTEGKVKYSEAKVSSFSLSPDGKTVAYNDANGLAYMTLTGKAAYKPISLASPYAYSYTELRWQKNSESFVYIKQYADTTKAGLQAVCLYRLANRKLDVADHKTMRKLLGQDAAVASFQTKFSISDDGKRVFYSVLTTDAPVKDDDVQIWNSSDLWTYNRNAQAGSPDSWPKVMAWWPETGRQLQLTDREQTDVFLSGDQKYAVTYNPRGNSPKLMGDSFTDYYITDLETGLRKKFLDNYSAGIGEVSASPQGKYLAYYTDHDIYIYTIATGKHINVSSAIASGFSNEDRSVYSRSIEVRGWTPDDLSMVIKDDFDLWEVNLGTLSVRRLTSGRENSIVFTMANSGGTMIHKTNFDGLGFPQVDLLKPFYLRAFSKKTKDSGYYLWHGKAEPIVFKDKSITQFFISPNKAAYYYIEQDYDASPTIMFTDGRSMPKPVYKSNTQQDDFYWGKSKLISFNNSKGKPLQGVLYYPANYDPDKKYPMAVYIYEALSHTVHDYVNPTLHNYIGFNITNLVTQDYFVLCPDIYYTTGDTGMDALDCTISATKSIIRAGLVDGSKVGLFGHSFGGYETAFIVTQTDLFATAIAAASVTDMASTYLAMNANEVQPDAWRFEEQQWRMGKSFYADKEGYLRNSPIMFADKINTPLLISTGADDRQVNPMQSMELHLALRRLGKPQVMLVYPEEGHVFMQQRHQEDFTLKVGEWFGYFLKGDRSAGWINNEMQHY